EADERSGAIRLGAGGAKGGGRGEDAPAKRVPDTGPGRRVTGAGAHTASRNASPSITRGGSRMRESRPYGSVRGALSNERPYRDFSFLPLEFSFPRFAQKPLKLFAQALAAQLAVEGSRPSFVQAAFERLGEVFERLAGDLGKVEVQRFVQRRPNQFDQFRLGMNRSLDTLGDEARVGDEKASVEAPHASRRRNRASQEVDRVERR